jgi:hypothetical protein
MAAKVIEGLRSDLKLIKSNILQSSERFIEDLDKIFKPSNEAEATEFKGLLDDFMYDVTLEMDKL